MGGSPRRRSSVSAVGSKSRAERGGRPNRGTLIRTQRRTERADRRNYSGKHRSHGLHFLSVTDENGRMIWISAARPGRTHDNTAARHDHILAHLRAAGLGRWPTSAFGAWTSDILDPVIATGYIATRTHKLTQGEKEANRALAVGRAPVEHGFATSKTGGFSPSSAPTPLAPPASCEPCSS
ncbi:transposase family protein [Streptomyces sp. NPDC059161]|uniref:transposase family protein n=1 Tax=Streptomyces sp. NPDC059161 TaxID=3346749 RepID=UPI00369DD2DA